MDNLIYYLDNPNLGKLIVETHDGSKEYRENCKKIKHLFYVKNKTCFEVGGLWYRIDSGLILFNHNTQQWVLAKNHNMIEGIIDFKNGVPVKGMFDVDFTKASTYIDPNGNEHTLINSSIGKGVIDECYSDGNFYNLSHAILDNLKIIKNVVNHKNKGYNIEDNAHEFEHKKFVYNKYQPIISTNVIRYAKYLEDITFGVEIETIAGYLPNNIQYQTGAIICRDGSLHAADGSQGPEYTTIPLSGAKGVQSIITLCKELTKRNKVDHQCSVHFHIGNIPTTRLFMTTLYKLGLMIQDDLFKMFPFYKTDEKKYADKDKNYCAKLLPLSRYPLKNLSRDNYESYIYDNYMRIFSFLSNDIAPSKKCNRRLGVHPKPDKWNRTARYHWLNLINAIFSKRNTIEFRIHQGSTNPQKIISWLFICNAIIKTAMSESSRILKGETITFNEVLNYYNKAYSSTTASAISLYLVDYYNNRTNEFNNLKDVGDYLGAREVQEDKEFFFDHSCFSKMFK